MTPLAAPDLQLIVHFPQGSTIIPGDEIPLFARNPVLLEAEP